MRYLVHRTPVLPPASAAWDDPLWGIAETLRIDRFHPRGSTHRPVTEVKLLHSDDALAAIFRVADRYVRATQTEYQSRTHQDSCVEMFIEPRTGAGYFNFEFNAIGTLLLWHIDKPRRADGTFERYTEIPAVKAGDIRVATSMLGPLLAEHESPLTWTLSVCIPVGLFEPCVGDLAALSGQTWRGNFYKCADGSSHPHWAAWSDIGERLDFHQPSRFGEIVFE